MTISGWILFIVIALLIMGISWTIWDFDYQNSPAPFIAGIAIIVVLLIGMLWWFNNTASGKRVQDDKGRWIVDYPLPRARKLINTILKYGTEEDFRKCEDEFKINARLYKMWDNLSQSQWKTDEPVIDIAF